MSKTIKLRKGFNIRLKGKAGAVLEEVSASEIYALKPTDFPGLTPRLSVKQGDEVKCGEPLFYDKYHPEVVFVSPVGGIVETVNRGERRRILEVLVRVSAEVGEVDFGKTDPLQAGAEEVKEKILQAGLWPFIRRRPYGTIARTSEVPKSIFISCFDTAPLAPDYDFVLAGREADFQAGVDALTRLTPGKVHLGLPATGGEMFSGIRNAEVTRYEGPHPAGNVGVHIHHTDPVNKGEVVWTVNPADVAIIGRLFLTGKLDFTRVVALTGPGVINPRYLKTRLGTRLCPLLEGNLREESKQRVISGNALTGKKVLCDNFLNFYDSQVTVIAEGEEYEFMGWAKPGVDKFSASKTFLSSLFPKKEYELNANLHGGERSFVLSGQYEKYLPMDLLPVHLLKAILVNDIDKMEQLGIYEVIGEDLALCEYACPSKIKVQDILRQGLELMEKELG